MKHLCQRISSSFITKLTRISTNGICCNTLKCCAHPSVSLLSRKHWKSSFSQRQYIHKCGKNYSLQGAGLQHHSRQRLTLENQPFSWLFVSDSVAGAYGAQVILELDLDKLLSGASLDTLKANVKTRGMQQEIDELVNDFQNLRSLENKKAALLEEKQNIIKELSVLNKVEKKDEEMQQTIQSLVKRLSEAKESISACAPYWDLEEKVILNALRLPNDLHHSTPLEESVISRESACKKDSYRTASHIDIAKKYGLIKFSSAGPKAYYLRGELVVAEMTLSDIVCEYLQSKKYRHLAGPEFVKSPIIEGCGQDFHDNQKVLTMLDTFRDVTEPMNHLAGVSHPTFAAYVAKTCIGDNSLPLNLFACGRTYQNSDLPGLFGAVQTTQAGVFSCVKKENVDSQYDATVDLIWDFIEPFGFPVRLCEICAKELRHEERRRIEVQMYSPGIGHFVTVASVSDLGDFISRRLMVIHNQNHNDIRSAQLVHMISGTVINITALLAIWMEYSMTGETKFSLKPLPSLQKNVNVAT